MALTPFFTTGQVGPSVFDPFYSTSIVDPFDVFTGWLQPLGSLRTQDTSAVVPFNVRIDWLETPDSHILIADVPGFKKSDIKVSVVDGRTLEISGERQEEEVQQGDTWHRVERKQGQFIRRFRLPENADVENVKAQVEDGVLRVTIPKKHKREPDVRQIEISHEKQGGGGSQQQGPSVTSAS
ncbi:hypothetical protein O6H91_Y063700 [Diphasiastrum complanatum]|nr:hypothetical protein O6H91_Y063700 [Diphasiastrum complanatum]